MWRRCRRCRWAHASVPRPAAGALECKQAGVRLRVESAQVFSWVAWAWRPTSAFTRSSRILLCPHTLACPIDFALVRRNVLTEVVAATGNPALTEAASCRARRRCHKRTMSGQRGLQISAKDLKDTNVSCRFCARPIVASANRCSGCRSSIVLSYETELKLCYGSREP